jgi:uncharacterized protein
VTAPTPKSTPRPRGEEQRWFDAAADGRLAYWRCEECGHIPSYPRAQCPACWSTDLRELFSTGRGEIYSFTVQYRPGAAGFKNEVPYAVALVTMAEGYRVLAQVATADPERIRIGDAVTVVFDGVAGDVTTLPRFRPVGEPT